MGRYTDAQMQQEELILVEDTLWLLVAQHTPPVYGFDFRRFLTCRHPWQRPDRVTAIARVGAFSDYEGRCRELAAEGITLVHSPEQYLLATELPRWYPLIEDLTPKSIWFDAPPDVSDVAGVLRWPVFVKGQRQTSRHNRALSIVSSPVEFERAMRAFKEDPILRWQKVVCREYLRLRLVEDPSPDRIPSSFEFRTFWWRGELAGMGRYWWEGKPYPITEPERRAAVAIAQEAASRLKLPFLVVDVAQTDEGRWVVIECNDAQESGYAGVPPLAMWQKIIDVEHQRT